jgi:putative acetyltransferase
VIEIRAEGPEQHAGIRRVHELAFGQPDEADLVDALRTAGAHVPELCLVALAGDAVVGHVMFSEARLRNGEPVLALAPMGVLPDRQRRGIGAALARESLARAAGTSRPLVVVVGHGAYYPRFGFEPGEKHGIVCPFPVPAEAWMVHLLPAYRPEVRGTVVYPAAFGAV